MKTRTNFKKAELAVLAIMTMMGAKASAQEHVGNGGGSHYCKGRSFQEMYDIYEGKTRYGLSFDENQSDEEKVLMNAVAKIRNINPRIANEVSKWINYLNKSGKLIANFNIKLTPVPDANVLMTDENCEYVQLANWDEVTQKVFVKPSVYKQLPPFHKAALKLHEAIYKVFRVEKKAVNSDQSRALVAQLLSNGPADAGMKNIQGNNDVIAIPASLPMIANAPWVNSPNVGRVEDLNVHVGNHDLFTESDVELVVNGTVSHPAADEKIKAVKELIAEDTRLMEISSRLKAKKIAERIAANQVKLDKMVELQKLYLVPKLTEKKIKLDGSSSKKMIYHDEPVSHDVYCYRGLSAYALEIAEKPLVVSISVKVMKAGVEIAALNYSYETLMTVNGSKDALYSRNILILQTGLVTQDQGQN